MEFLLRPGIKLMRQLRLFPKFCVVSLIFLLPITIITALLVRELNRTIDHIQLEQQGLKSLAQIQRVIDETHSYRAWHYLAQSGNAKAKEQAKQIRQSITSDVAALASSIQQTEHQDLLKAAQETLQAWPTLIAQDDKLKSSESYAAHSEFLKRLEGLLTQATEAGRLGLDQQAETNGLIAIQTRMLPEITASISDTVARGAPYIDTGLMQANDDVLINANLLLGQRDQSKLNTVFSQLVQQDPALQSLKASLEQTLATQGHFTERTKSEILNTLAQTNSVSFLENGLSSLQNWSTWYEQLSQLTQRRLSQRLGHAVVQRTAIFLGLFIMCSAASYLLVCFYCSFSAQVGNLRKMATAINHGDLRPLNLLPGRDELSILQHDFDGMRQTLIQLITRIRGSSESLNEAMHEIASGNLDLSRRTEQQSTTMSRTADSMTQLSREVENNTGHVMEASEQINQATEQVHQASSMMVELEKRISTIHHSSSQIHDIIGVIDAIAFQTNILALNAAVEAARAGDQGRGFAVVASEVRALAQRSAAAAKEIKNLITCSSQEVDAGHMQAQHSRATMKLVLDQIGSIAQHMHELAQASTTQNQEIQALRQNLTQIDSITQQNSALVEEAASASESLRGQVLHLVEAIAIFKTNDDQTSSTAISPRMLPRKQLRFSQAEDLKAS
ncbi:methyl-accepting chemotaxis protein [Undibacterium cyanobacteriorum]|uniref:Methyl-accepting chemotaxis protein n=1 Tax=Undibacterium cyanobacteriorum TaxID=3073561 RepID=A0ABY9RJD9_9BURK|nr:methyl-accepting chemotaxis protein [Undibacterium sp. 20NA77.5]WMW81046.1 methyl-accepting chemotaxis protein [Undibacterium sp. 20NA77.5]